MQIKVKAIPNSKTNSVEQISETEYRVKTTAQPEKGKANYTILKLLSKHLKIPKSQIILIKGEKVKSKTFEIV